LFSPAALDAREPRRPGALSQQPDKPVIQLTQGQG